MYGFLIDDGYIVFWLIHVLIIQQDRFQLCSLSMLRLMSWVVLPFSTSLSCHSARKACLELQNSHFKKRRKTFTHGESCQSGRMRGMRKCFCLALNQLLQRSLLSLRARVICWMMDSASSPSASRRMTGWEVYCEEWKFLESRNQPYRETKHTNPKGICCYVYGFLMMLGTSFFDWFMCWVLNKSGSYLGVCSSTL